MDRKKILITGAQSFIGTSVEMWLQQYPCDYQVETIDLKDDLWRKKDFRQYDVVFHVAGIAHSDVGKANEETKKYYYKINCDLTIEVAQKAQKSGIKQFVFMSSMIVYGQKVRLGKEILISKETLPKPDNFYGDSKLRAEKKLLEMQNKTFHVAILRPPMIYGEGGKGNFALLKKIANHSPLFPDIKNKRSILYIDNLCEFIRLLIDSENGGIYFPQNSEYASTTEMVRMIAEENGKKIIITPLLNVFIVLLSYMPGRIGSLVNKAFGSVRYDTLMSRPFLSDYQVFDLKSSLYKKAGEDM